MSEYQRYDFLALDRPLAREELALLRQLSTRAVITATSFTNTYHWSDFRGDPEAMVARFFDAHLYVALWGTRRLLLLVPSSVLPLRLAQEYCTSDAASARRTRRGTLFSVEVGPEDVGAEDDAEDWQTWAGIDDPHGDDLDQLRSIVPVRDELIAGDHRVLYLAWLVAVQRGYVDDDEAEPPVPAGLDSLTDAQEAFATLFGLVPELVDAAAQAAPDADAPPRTAGQLLYAEAALSAERARDEQERRARARAERDARAAVAVHQRRAALAREGEAVWARVAALVVPGRPGGYAAAIDLLRDLDAVAQEAGTEAAFAAHVEELRTRHARKTTFIRQLRAAGLTTRSH